MGLSARIASLLAALGAWCAAAVAAPTASFNFANSQLTLPTVRLEGGATYSNVVIRLNNFGTLAVGDTKVGADITYVPTTNTILLPAVTADGSFYYKVSLTNPSFDVVSVGAQVVPTTGYGSLAITGNAVGAGGQTNPATFVPAGFSNWSDDTFLWSSGSAPKVWGLTVGYNSVASNSSVGAWQNLQSITGGLSSIGVTLDMPKGTIQFKDVTLPPAGAYTGSMVLNGTLTFAPAVGTSVTITGTGQSEAGSGFDADAAAKAVVFQIGGSTKTDYLWKSRGITLMVSRYSTGDATVSVTNAAGPNWMTTSAKSAVSVDTTKKTVTLTNLVIPGKSPTTNSITLNGTLGYE